MNFNESAEAYPKFSGTAYCGDFNVITKSLRNSHARLYYQGESVQMKF